MSHEIVRTFEVAVEVERVWKAMTDPEELNQWYFPFHVEEDGSTRTEILGVERTSEVVEFEPPHKLCIHLATSPSLAVLSQAVL